ncbi:MAG: CBS domain-containing protein [Clostridiales bacterium]|jgi:predicted transcriptional regulator|nr:CBS domain-containing protein [Clostridiales bacterium]
MSTKHHRIIEYIKQLEVGTRISVRKIAQQLGVSEGTAYRAIKEAENQEYVKTFPRAGTLRIEKVEKRDIERLTYAEVVSIVDGTVLGGRKGLDKTLSRFVIGAMTIDAMKKYLSSGSLLIVGNREEAHRLALENDCAVLITGGFMCSQEIRDLADEKGLPVITSTYDTFTIATMINKAISEQMIKKEILLVEDIMVHNPIRLHVDDSIEKWRALFNKTGHSRFPVVNSNGHVVGIVTSKDIVHSNEKSIQHLMTPNPVTVGAKTTIAYAAHVMIWEGIELLPVTENKKLIGIVTNQDVIKALQYMRSQPQVGETLEDVVLSGFESTKTEDCMVFNGKVSPMLLNQIGTASWGAMAMLLSTMAGVAIRKHKQTDIILDSFTIYYVKPVQLDDRLTVCARVIEEGRNSNKVEVTCSHDKELVAKALLSARSMRK